MSKSGNPLSQVALVAMRVGGTLIRLQEMIPEAALITRPVVIRGRSKQLPIEERAPLVRLRAGPWRETGEERHKSMEKAGVQCIMLHISGTQNYLPRIIEVWLDP